MSGRRPVRTSLRATTVVLAVAASALSLTAVGTASPATAQPAGGTSHPLPFEDSRLPVPRRVADLLSRMTLE